MVLMRVGNKKKQSTRLQSQHKYAYLIKEEHYRNNQTSGKELQNHDNGKNQ